MKWLENLVRKYKKATYYWFDTVTHNLMEIDHSAPPIDCVRVKKGTIILIYSSRNRGKKHACIGGRALPMDAMLGLHSQSDFDNDNYDLIKRIIANIRLSRRSIFGRLAFVFERRNWIHFANPDVSGSRTASQKGIES